MEKIVDSIVFRRVTYADFFNINKVGGEEQGGGGQSYIDFPVANISILDWRGFLGNPTGTATQGPIWQFHVWSLGVQQQQVLKIYQRRTQSVSIAAQKLQSNRANRVIAWRPANGFPTVFPTNESLVVYIIKTNDQQFWAGWFKETAIPSHWPINTSLKRMFEEQAGIIKFNSTSRVLINTDNVLWPFYFKAVEVINQIVNEDAIEEDLVNEDVSSKLADIESSNLPPDVKQRIINIRKRNKAVVSNLKNLYESKCQISGEEFTFIKKNGERYSEVHHLISLGENGSDAYANAIVVSPLIHRMLHYAEVSAIDLNNIVDRKLPITINGVAYTITWHPDHISTVEQTLTD